MSRKREKLGGDLVRFIITLGAAAVVMIAVGLYFIHRLLEEPAPSTQLDFSRVVGEKMIHTEPPVSENAARVFFTSDGRTLSSEIIETGRDMTAYEQVDRLAHRLIKGPTSRYFAEVIPDKTSLRAIYITDNEVTLDFTKEIRENFQGGITAELLTVYSIVNTVTMNIQGVDLVRIMIEGEPAKTLAGEIDISAPLSANLNLVRW